MSIGRNNPCLCGSGKKYKKCCGKTEGSAIVAVLAEEASALQRELIDYAMDQHSTMLKKEFQPLLKNHEALRKNEQVFLVTFEIWAILTRAIKENETILTKFVKRRVPSIQRERTAELVASWLDFQFMAGIVESCDGPVYQVKNILTNETYSVRALKAVDLTGAFVTGALLPHEDNFTFFMTDFHFESVKAQEMAETVQALFDASVYEDANLFFAEEFPAIVNRLFAVYEKLENKPAAAEELMWQKEAHRETAEHIAASFQAEGMEQPVTDMAVLLWNYYCSKENPNVRKPEVFTAALISLLQEHGILTEKQSKAAVAGRYGISAATLSKRLKEMEAVLKEKLQAGKAAQSKTL